MRRLILILALTTFGLAASPPAAQACPLCKYANEEGAETGSIEAAAQNARPRAYMYSILFMLGMPATLLSGFGIAFYRMHRQQQAQLADSVVPGIDPFTA
jgi:hypothetical protein